MSTITSNLGSSFSGSSWCSTATTTAPNETSGTTNDGKVSMMMNDFDTISSNVDDGLTSLSWLQNLNMCMTRLGAPTPPTPPASPVCFNFNNNNNNRTTNGGRGQQENHHQRLTATNNQKISSGQSINKNQSTFKAESNSTVTGRKIFEQQQRQASSSTMSNNKKEPSTTNAIRSCCGKSTKKKFSNRKSISANISNSNNKSSINKNNNSNGQLDSSSTFLVEPDLKSLTIPVASSNSVDYKIDGQVKPPYSYATLICMAMKANKNKMTLSSIYKWIKENFLYYKNADPSWQNSIRHNLSLNKCFIKIARNKDEPGKGGFWKLDPIYADSLVDGIFKKRRPSTATTMTSNGKTSNRSVGEINGVGSNGSIRKKSRKKRASVLSPSVGAVDEFFIADYIESNHTTTIISNKNGTTNNNNNNIHHQETPPSSAESCSFKEHKMIDISELNSAINSIHESSPSSASNNNHSINNNNCTTYTTYTFPSGNLVECSTEQNLHDLHGFASEVCIGGGGNVGINSTSTTGNGVVNECIIETDGNDICWNAILTDVDLSELVDPIAYTDSVAQIIHPIEARSSHENTLQQSQPKSISTTAQLTAVQPLNDLDERNGRSANNNANTIVVDPNVIVDGSNVVGCLLDEHHQQLFYHDVHGLTFDTASNVIAATPNVVTCINDVITPSSDGLGDIHWNQWTPSYTANTTTASSSDQTSPTLQLDCPVIPIMSDQIISPTTAEHLGLNEINFAGSGDTPSPITAYLTSNIPPLMKRSHQPHNLDHSHQNQHTLTFHHHNDPIMAQATADPTRVATRSSSSDDVKDSQATTNFENANHHNGNSDNSGNVQVWECKTIDSGTETLELDNLAQLDQIHQQF